MSDPRSFTIRMTCTAPAFGQDARPEVARILREIAARLEAGEDSQTYRSIFVTGEKYAIGTYQLTSSECPACNNRLTAAGVCEYLRCPDNCDHADGCTGRATQYGLDKQGQRIAQSCDLHAEVLGGDSDAGNGIDEWIPIVKSRS